MAQYADVLLPLPLPTTYTYSLPQEYRESAAVGCRVVVPLGKSKKYTALIMALHDNAPQGYEVRPISELLDEAPILLPKQLELWRWIAKYYLCTEGEIYKAAVPQGLKGEFKARTEQRIRVAKAYTHERGIELALASLSRAPRQKRLLNTYLQAIGGNPSAPTKEISRHKLLEIAGVAPAVCKELIDKGILECYEVEIGRLGCDEDTVSAPNELNPFQQKAFESIKEQFRSKNTVLLHGVTSAGKTEIYIHLIKEAIERGEQVLYLLPEIALTKQIVERLKRFFGNRIGLYHSKFSDAERVEIWKKQLSDTPYDIILGVRSSLFLPFERL